MGDDEESEEVAVSRRKACPKGPTPQEVEEHEETHLPYRKWCAVCVAARGKDDGHPGREVSEDCKEVHLDYCFLRNRKGEEYATVLALKDRLSKLLCGHVVPNKGASVEWVISQALRDLQKMGHSNSVILRSDGEPALVDLLNQIAERRAGTTVVEHSDLDSKANGFIERGIQSLEELARLYKIDLERRIGTKIGVHSNVFAWLVEHATDMYNKKLIAANGKTAYERLKRKKHHGIFCNFLQADHVSSAG